MLLKLIRENIFGTKVNIKLICMVPLCDGSVVFSLVIKSLYKAVSTVLLKSYNLYVRITIISPMFFDLE